MNSKKKTFTLSEPVKVPANCISIIDPKNETIESLFKIQEFMTNILKMQLDGTFPEWETRSKQEQQFAIHRTEERLNAIKAEILRRGN